ncbi:MAG: DUF2318 domain-containing protein [Desulfomonile tiedjei]|nr:DUF2318 domain-containing protein [Desulfomonile tiedjei]
MNRNSIKAFACGVFVAAVIAFGILPSIGFAATGNFTVPCAEVKPQNGVFQFPASAFEDGKAKHFVYKHAPNKEVRFFVVKSTDGVIRAAVDACEVCYRSRKGYVQKANDMVCINCGLKFRTDKVNEVRGGCNPHPLNRTVKDGNVIITQDEVLSGLRYFQ